MDQAFSTVQCFGRSPAFKFFLIAFLFCSC